MRVNWGDFIKVSIVTISYNQSETLQRTIESVLNQDYSDIEYIVVDPGSKDGSRDLIELYRGRIALAILESDEGPADGLNKGFARASGEVFGFLNSDDVFCPGAVSGAVKFLLNNPNVDVVSGHATVIGPDDRVIRRTYSDRMNPVTYVYGGVTLIQPSTFFRRVAFQRVSGFNIANRISWDGELFLDMALAGCKFAVSDEIWSGYRLHAGTITASRNLDEARRMLELQEFRRVIGRDKKPLDDLLARLVRIRKHVFNPRDTVERILRGAIAGRQIE